MRYEIEEVCDIGGDWPAIEPLVRGIVEYHRPWDARTLREDWAMRMRDYMAGEGSLVLLARSDDRAIGFVHGHVRTDMGLFNEASGFIDNAFVIEEARRFGAGTALVERFEDWCRSRGATDVLLSIASGNLLGQGFWSKTGYETVNFTLRKALMEEHR